MKTKTNKTAEELTLISELTGLTATEIQNLMQEIHCTSSQAVLA